MQTPAREADKQQESNCQITEEEIKQDILDAYYKVMEPYLLSRKKKIIL